MKPSLGRAKRLKLILDMKMFTARQGKTLVPRPGLTEPAGTWDSMECSN